MENNSWENDQKRYSKARKRMKERELWEHRHKKKPKKPSSRVQDMIDRGGEY